MTMIKILRNMLALGLLFYGGSSYAADCQLARGTQNITIEPGEIQAQRDVRVGSTLYQKVIPASDLILGDCGQGPYTKQLQLMNLQHVDANPELYQSGVAGIGIRLKIGNTVQEGSVNQSLEGPAKLKDDQALTFSLVKTGAIEPGALKNQELLRINYEGADGNAVTAIKYTLSNGLVSQPSCQIENTAIVVPMGTLERKEFKGVNKTAGDKDFHIDLNCNQGTNVNITFAPLAGKSMGLKGVAGVVENEAGSNTAVGVGVQVLFDGDPVEFGKLIFAGTAKAEGLYSIPMKARFIQTQDTVVPGVINARMAFTMTYQ